MFGTALSKAPVASLFCVSFGPCRLRTGRIWIK